MKYTGRTAYILIAKRGNAPSNTTWYIEQVVKTLIPQALNDKDVKISAAYNVDSIDQIKMIALALRAFGNDVGDTKKYECMTENFSDADGDRGMILAAYYKTG